MDDPSASISLAQLTKVYIYISIYVLENVPLLASYSVWSGCLEGLGEGSSLAKQTNKQDCTYYYSPVKSRCGFEKIGGRICQPHPNVGVFPIFNLKTEDTLEATLACLFPSYPSLITHWKLTRFWRNSLVWAVTYVDSKQPSTSFLFTRTLVWFFLEYLNCTPEGPAFCFIMP